MHEPLPPGDHTTSPGGEGRGFVRTWWYSAMRFMRLVTADRSMEDRQTRRDIAGCCGKPSVPVARPAPSVITHSLRRMRVDGEAAGPRTAPAAPADHPVPAVAEDGGRRSAPGGVAGDHHDLRLSPGHGRGGEAGGETKASEGGEEGNAPKDVHTGEAPHFLYLFVVSWRLFIAVRLTASPTYGLPPSTPYRISSDSVSGQLIAEVSVTAADE